MTAVTVACCQLAPSVGEPEANLRSIREAVHRSAAAGAQIVVLPELASSGYVFSDHAELVEAAEAPDGPTVTAATELAAELGIVVVVGFPEAGDDGLVYNSAVLADPSGVRAIYRKAHLWDSEKPAGFTPGDAPPPVVDTPFGRIAVMICYDLEFPEWSRTAALGGADLLVAPTNWPLFPRPEGERPMEVVKVQANASVNRMAIALADRAGTERGQDWVGGSVIVDQDGYPLTALRLGEEADFVATLDLAESRMKAISDHNDVFRDRRPELYGRVTE
ncbi:nitrilase family protein [Leifsonia sp. AG29]|uniref:nitrilase family protein n=1 Tax=Leifsonia sp. AG29 TaxID=2598860 RepID=UPI00131D6667|nr:nitrilase family protein [Leifsonia sp. AG29]